MIPLDRIHRLADRTVRLTLPVPGGSLPAFQACGLTGLALAIVLGVLLTLHAGLSLGVLAAMVATGCATFLGLAWVTKVVVGEERLIYYHHEVAILTTVALVLWALGQPLPAYLDVTLLCIGTFLLCGRVGCFLVGCCHGRPCRTGVCYGPDHAAAGFTPYLVGVRLFPVQLLEALWVLVTVAVGVAMMLGGSVPGAALAWYVIVYDVGRFGFEFLRGDPSRPYRAGFSEGQWTSLLLMVVVVVAEALGFLPFRAAHLAATGAVAATMVAVALARWRRGDLRQRLFSPRHIGEVAVAVGTLEALDAAEPGGDCEHGFGVHLSGTSAGLRVSTGRCDDARGALRHYTLSGGPGGLRAGDAAALGRLLARLRHHGAPQVIPGQAGIFHLIVDPPGPAPGTSSRSDDPFPLPFRRRPAQPTP